MNGFLLTLLCCDDRERGMRNFWFLIVQRISSFQTKTNQVSAFAGLTGFCSQSCLNGWGCSQSDAARAWEAWSQQNPVKETILKAGKHQSDSKHQGHIIPDVVITSSEPVMSLSSGLCLQIGVTSNAVSIPSERSGVTFRERFICVFTEAIEFCLYDSLYTTKRLRRAQTTCHEFAHLAVFISCCIYCRFLQCGRKK